MRRPAGVTIAAVAVFIGSGLTLLSGAIMIFAFFVLPATESAPAFTRAAGVIMAIFMLGLAAWGIATGINLLQLREWARISMIVFSALLLVTAVPGLLMMLVMPFPMPQGSAVPAGVAAPQMESMM